MPRSKRYQALIQRVDRKKLYAPNDAVALAKETANTKFESSVEVHMRLGIDPKKGEQQVRGTVVFPHSTGVTKRIAVFTDTKRDEATEAGADLVGGKELIAEIKKTGKCDFDIAVAEPAMMKEMAVIAKVLGPKGLMPSPKNETVTPNIKKTVAELKKGKAAFKNDDSGNLHIVIGKATMDAEALLENFQVLLDAVKRAKPPTAKGTYVQNITLTSSMGPGIRVGV